MSDFCLCTPQRIDPNCPQNSYLPASDEALDELRRALTSDEDRDTAPGYLDRLDALDNDGPGDAMLTVVFLDGRKASVPIMVPTSGEAVVLRDGILLAEDHTMRCYSFPNVSHWWTDAV